MIANVKIRQDKEKPWIHRVYKDGKQLTRVRSIDFNVEADTLPELTVEIGGGIDFDGMADIHFDYSPCTIKEACKILREELLKHEDLYRAFSASIYSALNEMPDETWIDEMPEIILSRIIGEESDERKD